MRSGLYDVQVYKGGNAGATASYGSAIAAKCYITDGSINEKVNLKTVQALCDTVPRVVAASAEGSIDLTFLSPDTGFLFSVNYLYTWVKVIIKQFSTDASPRTYIGIMTNRVETLTPDGEQAEKITLYLV